MQTTRQQPTAPQISCLLVPSLALAVELAERPGLGASGVGAGEQPAALADEAGLRVAEASLAALDRGVRPGQTLREAVAYCPALAVVEPRPARARQVAAQLVEAVEAISPLVEEAAPGEVYADLRGLEGLYPRPGALEQALLAAAQLGGGALGGKALGARLGVAGSRFTARAAAHAAAPGEWLRVAAAEARAFLAPLPSEWLPLEAAAQGWLRLLGLETLGDLAALPRHAVEAQFGPAGGQAWLAARGEDPTPLTPRRFRERVIETAQAQPPLVSREAVLHTVEQLLGRALRQPQARRRFVRAVRLQATTEDEHAWERTRVLKEPTGDRTRLWTAIRPALEAAEFGGPIAELSLELGGLTAESARQVGLFREYARRREQLDEMTRHLKVRYGQSPLRRVVAVEPWSRIPERRHALIDYDP